MQKLNVPHDFEKPQWYVLLVRSNREKLVAHHLAHRGVEHFLPLYQSLRQWKDRRVKLDRPLFPGYVFIKLPFRERIHALTVPNVVSIVGTKTLPTSISEDEMTWIKRGVEHGRVEPHPYLSIGARVVITSGIMSGLEGILLREQKNTRILVCITSIARAFVVELEGDCVQPVDAKRIHLAPAGSGRLQTAS